MKWGATCKVIVILAWGPLNGVWPQDSPKVAPRDGPQMPRRRRPKMSPERFQGSSKMTHQIAWLSAGPRQPGAHRKCIVDRLIYTKLPGSLVSQEHQQPMEHALSLNEFSRNRLAFWGPTETSWVSRRISKKRFYFSLSFQENAWFLGGFSRK